jgi:hypothetical protein
MVRIAVANTNKVYIELPDGKIFSISTDDGSALSLALKVTDNSEVFDREDRAEEVTEPGVAV